jgi:ribosomal protein S27E
MRFDDFECPSCSNRRQVAPEVLTILCRDCGALLVLDRSGTWATGKWVKLDDNPGDIPRERFLTKRQAVVVQSMEQARRSHEPGAWRMFAYEAKGLELCLNPDLLPEKTTEAQFSWLEEVVLGELMTFDSRLQDALGGFKTAARRLKSANDVDVVREMLARAIALYKSLLGHVDCPASLKGDSPNEYGRNMVLATLESFRRTLGTRAVDALIRRALPEGKATKNVACPACRHTIRDVGRDQIRILCTACGTPVAV